MALGRALMVGKGRCVVDVVSVGKGCCVGNSVEGEGGVWDRVVTVVTISLSAEVTIVETCGWCLGFLCGCAMSG